MRIWKPILVTVAALALVGFLTTKYEAFGLLFIPIIIFILLGIVIGIPTWIYRKYKRERFEDYHRKLVRCPGCGLKNYRRRITTGKLVCNSCGFVWNPFEYGQIYY